MERTLVRDLASSVGQRVRVKGWLHHARGLKSVAFLLIRDRTGIVQVVIDDPAEIARYSALEAETVVQVDGDVVSEAQAAGGVELHAPHLEVISPASAPSPIELRRPVLKEQLPTRLEHAALALRHPRARAAFTISAAAVAGFRQELTAQGFTEIATPKIVGAATESGANVFALDWFGKRAFLAQSPQLYKQIMVGVFERVFETGPVFRAEPHDTARHLAEYVSLDCELAFIDDHHDVMRVARDTVAAMLATVAADAAEAVELVGCKLPVGS